jgi:hypothetical protein
MPDHDDIARFRDVAADYLACIDAAGDQGADRTMRTAAAILGGLYAAAINLPQVEHEVDDVSDGTEPGDAWEALYRRLGDAGVGTYYWQLDPFLGDRPGEEGVGDLADDLADIYLDLRRGFAILDAGASINDAVWDWRFSFESHWGQHAVDALRVIHALLNGERDPKDEGR